jgi:cytochrome P450
MTETVSGASDLDDDVFSPSAIRDPYTYYGRIRETDPVRWNERHRVWVVTRFNDVARINGHRYLVTPSPGQIGEP